jgi:hypothetical protein
MLLVFVFDIFMKKWIESSVGYMKFHLRKKPLYDKNLSSKKILLGILDIYPASRYVLHIAYSVTVLHVLPVFWGKP